MNPSARFCIALLIVLLCTTGVLHATPTENIYFRVLPTDKAVVDGKTDGWDLSGGILVCDDVEEQRLHFAVWLHAQYDAENLYLLARWMDETPLNNPGQTIADYGFAGDCLQFRTITAAGTPQERGQHFTAWRGRDGADVIKIEQGTNFKEGVVADAKKLGAQQAFAVNADGKGYVQEIAVPWKLLTRDGQPLKPGESFTLTFEPNFTIGTKGRLSLKDLFKPGVTPDRVFTFMSPPSWGTARLEARGHVKPQPVRLADSREFPVKLEKGVPVVDWTGLIKSKELIGFKPITFTMPADGYISLNVKNAEGQVVRQLLNAAFFSNGPHQVKWDGLTTPSWTRPGEPVPVGEYTWTALVHSGIGLKLRGWAANGGVAPWDGPSGKDNWGGDHGVPSCCAANADQVYLGWTGAEAGKAVLACDLQGNVRWSNNRSGIAGAKGIAADGGVVYVLGGRAGSHSEGGALYKLDAKTGSYITWGDAQGADGGKADVIVNDLWDKPDAAAEKADALTTRDGGLFLSFGAANRVVLLNANSGKLLKTFAVENPSYLAAANKDKVYVVSGGKTVLALDTTNGATKIVVKGLKNAAGIAVGRDDRLLVGVREPDNQIHSFAADGRPAGSIGRKGGRPTLGKWDSSGMAFVGGIAVDDEGKIWAAEVDGSPKRISVWDSKSGNLVHEFFGPTAYGALGGAINPLDPDLMVGEGCEWRLDPQTGRATCLGVITREGMENSRFGIGLNGKQYLAVATRWAFDIGDLNIFERVGDGEFRLRTKLFFVDKEGNDIPPPAHGKTGAAAKTAVWADENGDGQRQPQEVTMVDGIIRVTGWYLPMTSDLTLHSADKRFLVAGFTSCGAPKYDLARPVEMPMAGWASTDGKYVFANGEYNVTHGLNKCVDMATGKLRWTYPDNFVGVHGSHNACPPEGGMIRGSYGPCGTAKLPAPIGNIWVIPTNVGEWHLLNEDGFYLSKLFEGDPLKVKWPDQALPGADMSRTPPGMGGEDFGGSIALAQDGKLYVQAGKTGFWNLEVTGLENVKPLQGGKFGITANDVAQAAELREAQLQTAVGKRQMTVKKMRPIFSGKLNADFKGADIISYKKQDDAAVRSTAAWDDEILYLGWEVQDNTPWTNGATDASQMYLGGDTVDFQLGTDTDAAQDRKEAILGDLRLSIGNFQGQPTAVLYRKVAKVKKSKVFSSGVVKEYAMDFVDAVPSAKIVVTNQGKKGYVVEAAIPLASLNFKPNDGLSLGGDFGATHGDPSGQRTRLRTYWNNQHTGIVDDAVFELMMEPKNWGKLIFQP